jgi:wyosine [tRNA(Phe)-imidazoG37] synthetase (radical SAM superfamily)
MKFVYGPVYSRRLGQSLGVDPVPLKTCNWNCVYCQLGRSKPMVNERKEYFPAEDILVDVKQALALHTPGDIDWITFVGSGETTLHSRLGWLINEVKVLTQHPVAVITNGSLLYLPEMREELALADAVLPSLDAGTQEMYQRVNRPMAELPFESLLEGLITFRKEYQGKLWVEVMLLQGLNDTELALRDIANALVRIQPDEVHILLPTRPPVETWVQPADEDGLLRARAILGDIAHVIHPGSGSFDLSGNESLVDAVVGIITRHPMRESELIETLQHWSPGDITATMLELESSGKAQIVERFGIRFWSASPSIYPEVEQSERTDIRKAGAGFRGDENEEERSHEK